MNRRRSVGVALGLTTALAGVMGYGYLNTEDPDYAGVCVDSVTSTRLADTSCECVDPEDGQTITTDECGDDTNGTRSHGHWSFIRFGSTAPRIGQVVSGVDSRPPTGHSFVSGGVPDAGGVVSSTSVRGGSTTWRGGFGSGFGKSGG
jgi:hypothetical protein